MRILVHMKCPDALQDAIERTVESEVEFSDGNEGDQEFAEMCDEISKLARKWFRFGEVLTVTFDTDSGTCFVEEA